MAVALKLQTVELPDDKRSRLDELRAAIRTEQRAVDGAQGTQRAAAVEKLVGLRRELLGLVKGAEVENKDGSTLALAREVVARGGAVVMPILTRIGAKILIVTSGKEGIGVLDLPEMTTDRLNVLVRGDGKNGGWLGAYNINYLQAAELNQRWPEWLTAVEALGPELAARSGTSRTASARSISSSCSPTLPNRWAPGPTSASCCSSTMPAGTDLRTLPCRTASGSSFSRPTAPSCSRPNICGPSSTSRSSTATSRPSRTLDKAVGERCVALMQQTEMISASTLFHWVCVTPWLSHVEFDARSPVWMHWLRELSSNHTYIHYDQRGCGLSDRVLPALSFDAWLDDLETVADALNLKRFALLGMSQGGAVAIAYAAHHPERVSHLVLLGACARPVRQE